MTVCVYIHFTMHPNWELFKKKKQKNMHLRLERLVWMDKYRCLTRCVYPPFQKQSLLGTRAEAIYLCVWLLPNTENTVASKRLREVVPKKGIMCTPFDPVPLLETYLITITACIQWHINKDVYCSIIWKIKTCKHECSTTKEFLNHDTFMDLEYEQYLNTDLEY